MLKTVRIEFSKTGRAKYISHLDLMRTMTRALRRADIPLWYTEGFNRHPYITFAAPLSLGYEGLCETMDLRLEGEMADSELTSRLDAVMPDGLRVLSAHEAEMKPGQLTAARYRLFFACEESVLAAFLQQPVMPAEKRTKKGGYKTVDIKPALSEPALSACAEGCCLEVTLPCSSAETINPQLIRLALSAFAGHDVRMQVTRTALFGPDGVPFR